VSSAIVSRSAARPHRGGGAQRQRDVDRRILQQRDEFGAEFRRQRRHQRRRLFAGFFAVGSRPRERALQQHPHGVEILRGTGTRQIQRHRRPNRRALHLLQIVDARERIDVGHARQVQQRLRAHVGIVVGQPRLDA
jgi:hypothetical protein